MLREFIYYMGGYVMTQKLDRETLDKLVDVILEYNGTPRRYLFEYPYNEFQSRDILRKAETAARNMAGILGVT